MYKFYLIMKTLMFGISVSISNYIIESKTRALIKYHNRTVKKAVKRYNKKLKKMTRLNNLRIKIRDKILNNRCLQKYFSVEMMEKLENSIEELNDIIVLYHDDFLDYLNSSFDKSKEVICEYNKIVDKQKRNTYPFIFYKCTKISMNEIIHSVKYPNRKIS